MMPRALRSCAVRDRIRQRAIDAYRRMYYGPLRCSRPFRITGWLFAIRPEAPIACKNHRIIYYAIPKTGCTTIRSLLLEAESHPVPDDDEAVHLLIRKKMSGVNARAPRFDDYFKFAFVRNPWARLVSCYRNKISNLVNTGEADIFASHYGYIHFKRMSFADFARFVCRVPDDLCDSHFKPQSAFFDAAEVDFVGRFERFSDDLAQVIERAGLDRSLHKWCDVRRNPQRLTKADNDRYYIDFYDAKTRRLVAAKYKSDIERFGYRFGE